MIFRRKKPSTPASAEQPVMRGRDSAANKDNPLARRFHPDDEPDTIDLQKAAGFISEPDTAEPAEASPATEKVSVVTLDPGTGKLHVQPGEEGQHPSLGDDPVHSATELRSGDFIRIGEFELHVTRLTDGRDSKQP